MDQPVAFHTLSPDDFPFTVKFISEETNEVVHEIYCDSPGMIEIPALGKKHGPVNVEIHWPDGTVEK